MNSINRKEVPVNKQATRHLSQAATFVAKGEEFYRKAAEEIDAAKTDCEFLLAVLSDGEEHTQNEILRRSFAERGCGLTVHSRASDLRAKGYFIAWHNDPRKRRGDSSVYRLVTLEASAIEESPGDAVSLADASSVGDHAPSFTSGRSASAETPTLAPQTAEEAAAHARKSEECALALLGAAGLDQPALFDLPPGAYTEPEAA